MPIQLFLEYQIVDFRTRDPFLKLQTKPILQLSSDLPNHAWFKRYHRWNFGHEILDFDKILLFLSNKARCANFDLTTMFYIENRAHTQIIFFYVKWIFKLTPATTVKYDQNKTHKIIYCTFFPVLAYCVSFVLCKEFFFVSIFCI